MPTEDTAKVCPSCKKRDITSFSKCRYCGTRYDAKVAESAAPNIDQRFIAIICVVVLLIGAGFWVKNSLKEARDKGLASIITEVRAAKRPRVVELYADWCGPCRGYGPVIEACRAKYSGRIDFQRLNTDTPYGQQMVRALNCHGIPMTCMFDSQGNEVDEVVGGMGTEQLDEYMHKLLKSN